MMQLYLIRSYMIANVASWLAPACLVLTVGCARELDVSYGRSGSASINGTKAFAELLKGRGHQVRSAFRLTDGLSTWADAIVRVAPYAGGIELEEADWYEQWLSAGARRTLVFIARDEEQAVAYWRAVQAQIPADADDGLRARVQDKLTAAEKRSGSWMVPRVREAADKGDWFGVEGVPVGPIAPPIPFRAKSGGPPTRPASPPLVPRKPAGTPAAKAVPTTPAANSPPTDPHPVAKTLDGLWAQWIDDPKAAAIPMRWPLIAEGEEDELLTGDDKPLVITWRLFNGSNVVVVANGSFVLNGGLLNRARRSLTIELADQVGLQPRRVAFVEGNSLSGEDNPSVFALLQVDPFGWVFSHLALLGLAAALAAAPILGRPRRDAPSRAERPAAHPEALGVLMRRAGQLAEARAILETYRRRRHSGTSDISS